MSFDVEKAAIVSGPLNGNDPLGTQLYSATDTSNRAEVRNITLSTTAASIDLNDIFGTDAKGHPRWRGRFLRMTGTAAFDYFFAPTTDVACVYQAKDTSTPESQGEHMPADYVDQVIPSARYIMWDAAGSGVLSLSLRSPVSFG